MAEFTWDPKKARSNIRKHAVSFEEAITVFDDPLFVIFQSQKHSIDENRYVIIGMSERGRLLAVAFSEGEEVRIISARELTTRERRNYEKQDKEI